MLRLTPLLRRAAAAAQPRAVRFPEPGQLKLSIDEALYLAKEAGVWTTQEVQMQIVRSPPFSSRENPFLLENFFEGRDTAEEQGEVVEEGGGDQEGDTDLKATPDILLNADPTIHGAIQKYFRKDLPAKFLHNGEEWLSRAEGRGTRKRASAHVVITRGSGVFKVNGESDMFAWFPMYYHRFDMCQPFKLTGTAGVYDVFVQVQGGGISGQAGAARLAIARALLTANPGCHDNLQRGYCLLEDTRQKMSKMPGKAAARASFAWTKR